MIVRSLNSKIVKVKSGTFTIETDSWASIEVDDNINMILNITIDDTKYMLFDVSVYFTYYQEGDSSVRIRAVNLPGGNHNYKIAYI